ncbi:hypothetical protein [Flavobacterium turcicum]|uniref:Uncharacterized protein n=1 Tax=Flavobacterium turcicum TaxID=2764718 RepID=A0ABR7JEE7_9FLAO|nr:hypothetical protein [Flavobacterium turcicum]MBC5862874.1 hypothetical protein [Flavobacterium turcicum]NHL01606.1 hypothetical protein [Flavobacterium turcicum]
MKFSFKKKHKIKAKDEPNLKGHLIQKINEAIIRLQCKCAHWLEVKTAHLSPKSWIVLLVCFVGVTGTCCIYVINGSFSNTDNAMHIVKMTKTKATQPKKDLFKSDIPVSKTEFEKIIHFRKYMDSLGRSTTGKILYDRIARNRPGLLDSLSMIENYYYSQFKN